MIATKHDHTKRTVICRRLAIKVVKALDTNVPEYDLIWPGSFRPARYATRRDWASSDRLCSQQHYLLLICVAGGFTHQQIPQHNTAKLTLLAAGRSPVH
jgi:hypothetical protein